MDTTRTMITFKQAQAKFTYRIGGIVIHNDHILFQRATRNPENIFWFLPGGRAELGEDAEHTLRREMIEELDTAIQIERLVYIVENFFTDKIQHHELGLYFLMTFPPDAPPLQEKGIFLRPDEDEEPMTFEWLPREKLSDALIFPKFLRTALLSLPKETMHIIQNDE